MHANIEVQFNKYCPKCVNWETDETQEPCNTCLEQPYNEDSCKPVSFKGGKITNYEK